MAKEKAKFTTVSPNETKIEYKGNKFLLRESSRGVYGSGSSIGLLLLEGFQTKYLKEIGWTKGDNHGSTGKEKACITHITDLSECKVAAVKYIDSLS